MDCYYDDYLPGEEWETCWVCGADLIFIERELGPPPTLHDPIPPREEVPLCEECHLHSGY